MFRNQYDGDNTTWSPQGRIHQVEYAMEAVKQGSATVGLKSKTHAVVVALKRSSSELASYQKKIIKIDNHLGVSFSGLTSDARVLGNYMRSETMKSRLIYNRPMPVSRMASAVGEKAQVNTQRYGSRPYGVGLIIAGLDEAGPHLYECSPSGNVFDYLAVSIGARSQSAKTYLENHLSEFPDSTLEELIIHGLRSLRDTLQQDKVVTVENASIGYVGIDSKFTILDGPDLKRYIDMIEGEGVQDVEMVAA